MNYVEQNLIAGEQVRYRTGLHWVVLVAPAIFSAVFGIMGQFIVLGAVIGRNGGTAFMAFIFRAFAAALFIIPYLNRTHTEMAVTNKQVLIKTGIIRQRSLELMLCKVESIGADRGLICRILECGIIVVRGTGTTNEPFKIVARPLEFRTAVQQQIDLAGRA